MECKLYFKDSYIIDKFHFGTDEELILDTLFDWLYFEHGLVWEEAVNAYNKGMAGYKFI